MRPKTFPATTYSGNSRQRLQEIREGLKQPPKTPAPGPPAGPGSDAALDAKALGGKDAARQQQQTRTAPKFGPYQKALREIRYSLLPFANESGPSAAAEVNRQMLQELVDAGCDQEMAGRALKQTGSRSIEAALEFISKMGYLEPGKEQIVRVVKQTSPGKGLAPASVPRRPSFEGAGDPFPPYAQVSGPAFEGPAALDEVPRQYPDFLFAAVGPHCRPHPPKGYAAAGEAAGMSLPGPGGPAPPLQGPHYRAPLLVPGEPLAYGVQRSPSFQSKTPPEVGGYAGLAAKGPAVQVQVQPGLAFPPPGGAAAYAPHPHPKQPHPVHAGGPRGAVFAGDSPPPGLATPSRTGLGAERFEPSAPPAPQWPSAGLARRDSLQKPGPSRTGSFNGHQAAAAPSPNAITAVTAAHILHAVKSVRVMRPEPQTAVGPSHPAWVPPPGPALEGLEPQDEHPPAPGGAEARGRPPPYPRHLLRPQGRAEQYDVDGLCAGLQQGLRGSRAAEPPDGSPRSPRGAKGEKAGKDRKQIQTSPVPVRRGCRDEEKRESRIKSYSPSAFKFFMEQHVENVLKTYQQKVARRLQLEQEMAKAGLCEAEQEQMRKILYQKESNYNRLKRAKMDKSMFVKVKTLGVGAFGEVCLACKVDTHALYAMKTLRKKDVLNRNQVAHVKAERDILAEADNEWVVKLYYSFQDKDSLYFVMDYIPGGDMMSLLIRMEVFPEHLARFYIAELTLAIESVHKMGFIHRDIKPDNILIDLDGHIKLTDFGLCTGFRWTHNSKYYQKGSHTRQDSMEPSDLWDDVSNCRCGDRLKTLEQRARRQHQRCLAHSLVGTPNYIAPEVLLRKGYTQLCDWWSVGVILFEMLVGQPPFLAPTPTETQLKVINWESTLHIPAQVELSPEARDLIAKLCCAAEHRLGRNGADDLKAHPFLGAIDFSSDIRRQPAPYVPTISHPMDTSNFDPVDEEGPWQDGSEDSSKAWDALGPPGSRHPEHAFYEFTFRRFFDDNGYPFRCPKPAVAETGTEAEQPAAGGPAPGAQAGSCQPVYV
ncbi:serine/threonine-protein kinase LATS2 isoform X1 [Sagmatias obliquidens]|uniref:serine/threonine-protein kinase LATS2 isoform X1 n=1 Tax=Sagmatias obliquidens TaxID=3371155 RepID=UPI000F441BB2|nr:serine/threonine-protein kinase LATS2 isoform X1 [Lagenorhynchus obliquidens]XP_026972503.1 serine/threonine-protein kinase LATS2 isoform X1 [Lagenorhynchus obliquidens]XP_026972504.1 serine/threonine-protein kinase LATS2 isoform X1 [Lagenorhynchus obliquidens]XP_026972505.1 serine/threonine-protein kinase LATS2 isoform X1 [Lagenorhynchus obliquidens]XP_026972506.1 serine/threonine-protein kinase LATS2 isoform X1 [Lagenorhynchus obliquidens]